MKKIHCFDPGLLLPFIRSFPPSTFRPFRSSTPPHSVHFVIHSHIVHFPTFPIPPLRRPLPISSISSPPPRFVHFAVRSIRPILGDALSQSPSDHRARALPTAAAANDLENMKCSVPCCEGSSRRSNGACRSPLLSRVAGLADRRQA